MPIAPANWAPETGADDLVVLEAGVSGDDVDLSPPAPQRGGGLNSSSIRYSSPTERTCFSGAVSRRRRRASASSDVALPEGAVGDRLDAVREAPPTLGELHEGQQLALHRALDAEPVHGRRPGPQAEDQLRALVAVELQRRLQELPGIDHDAFEDGARRPTPR